MSSIDSNVAIPVHIRTMIPIVTQEKRKPRASKGQRPDGG
jgi:hypothetical protein